ncbi:MAG: glycosyltransferase [Cyanobacteria bacterium J06629_19]
MVYSHDAFGLGNLRRMLAICEHLLTRWPNLSILLVSGSPMIHEFRLPVGLDYIKLPCLNRGLSGDLCAKYLGTPMLKTVELRSQLIYSAALHFQPHLFLVDKKPTGLAGELSATLHYLKNALTDSKCVLLLRDILDTPQKTIREWDRYGYCQTVQAYYDQVLVVGMQSVFDMVQAYQLPLPVAHKLRYCGYIRKPLQKIDRDEMRSHFKVTLTDPFVLVTPGGGEDGYRLVHTYLQGLQTLTNGSGAKRTVHSLILCGPEMPADQFEQLQQLGAQVDFRHARVTFQSFTHNLFGYLQAADVVVSMGGYNTLTEIVTARKRSVVVPRMQPSQEQLIRATCFSQKGLITMLSPTQMTPSSLMQAVLTQLDEPSPPPEGLDFGGLPQVLEQLGVLISPAVQPALGTPLALLA